MLRPDVLSDRFSSRALEPRIDRAEPPLDQV